MNRINWRKDFEENHEEEIYVAVNDKDEDLGWLVNERVGQWMHWCWYQFDDIRMSPGCLQEVRDKQRELSQKR